MVMSTEAKRGRYYGAWCSYLRALMEENMLRPAQFAETLREKRNNLTQYMSGQVRPPVKKLEPWARALNLTESERAKFIRLGLLEWAPKEVREEMETLRRRAMNAEATIRLLALKCGEDPSRYGL